MIYEEEMFACVVCFCFRYKILSSFQQYIYPSCHLTGTLVPDLGSLETNILKIVFFYEKFRIQTSSKKRYPYNSIQIK
jgi:hypothetical protein